MLPNIVALIMLTWLPNQIKPDLYLVRVNQVTPMARSYTVIDPTMTIEGCNQFANDMRVYVTLQQTLDREFKLICVEQPVE